ncbi:tetratricopeptide repeat protein [Rhodanobacter sp. DHB23]|uniref:tetratricopeptide repeat protein n=1 Tax=Rhodanobacter sp. DHB23 TaxID=2775923 RepID=UPI001781EE77|nr:tetratricopeptide repeat protein [Rhodanobacter sp. DHB23]MBD8873196.1 tetratricopeptide repeat protein [Rhodanobacter sp. DHB23]
MRHFTAAVTLMLGLAGCAQAPLKPAAGPAPASTPQPLAHLVVATPDAEHDLLAQLMAGEMALGHSDLKSAALHYGKAMAISTDPGVAERAAALAIAVHDDDAASRALDRWQSLGAKPAAMAQARAQLALDRGDTLEAQRQLRILTDGRDKNAWRSFGQALVAARDQAQAGQLLEALATPQRLPADPQAWLAMSELGDKLGRHAYAQRIADAAMARFPDAAEVYVWSAQMKAGSGDTKGALALLQQANARLPDDTRLRLVYASLLSESGDDAAAARVLEHGPQSADTYQLRAALAAHGKDAKALAALYRQLQQAAPDVRTQNAFLLGQLAEMQHRDAEALAWYNQVGDDDPHAFDADLRSAVLLQAQGKGAEAHELLGQMEMDYLDQPKQLRQAWELDAEIYMQEQSYPRAVDAFTRALQVAPNDPGLLYGRGLAYASAGQIDPAVQDFRSLLKLKPDDIDASNALGFTLADADRDLPEAARLIAKARAARPNDPAIADSWGWVQYRLGHLDQAVQSLRSAWQAGKDADIGVHLGEVLWKQGDRQGAQRVFDAVRRMDPHNASLQDTLKRLNP